MREQQANYATGQDYGTPVSNMPRSARRYQTYQSARRPTVEQVIEDVETVEVELLPSRIPARNTASRGNRVIEEGYSQRQPRRARTDEDRYIDERVIPQQSQRQPRPMAIPQQQVPPPQRQRVSRRGFLLKLGGMALGFVAGGVVLGKWAGESYNSVHQQIEQGQQPATSIYLKCGHNDSDAHKTQLQVFINQDDRSLVFVELPGGDITKAHLFKTPRIDSPGDMKYWHVGITPNLVDAGKYMIGLTVRTPDDNIIHQWLLVDSGQGFFRAVNPK